MRKTFLAGIFSVVSFILISTFVIPSTFAQCPPDVSGRWVVKATNTTECCSDPSDNGVRKFKGSIPGVVQVGNTISASWDVEGGHNELTGILNGNSVYFKVEGTDSDEPCGWIVIWLVL